MTAEPQAALEPDGRIRLVIEDVAGDGPKSVLICPTNSNYDSVLQACDLVEERERQLADDRPEADDQRTVR